MRERIKEWLERSLGDDPHEPGLTPEDYCVQLKPRRLVALKMIKGDAFPDEHERKRFQQEAEAIARLQHPHIVQVYEVGEHQGRPFFSLELVEGSSLHRKLDGKPLPSKQAAELIETLARAIHAAHQKGIIHRDLKPGNILLAADGTPKVTDFGLAKRLDESVGPTMSGAVVGTPSYMPPEQARGESKAIGPAADVYALGAILYECLTGRAPFVGEDALSTLYQVVQDDPVPPRRLQPKVPAELETICLKCLEKEAGKRYASAEDLAEDLRRFLAGEPIAARPAGRAERAVKWTRRKPAVAALWATSAVAVAALVTGATLFVIRVDAERQKAVNNEGIARQQGDEARKQLQRARANLFTAQLMRVAGVYERNPEEALQLLHDYDACPIDLRDVAWYFYTSRCGRRRRDVLIQQPHPIHCLAFSPDGKTVALGEGCGEKNQPKGEVRLCDVATGREFAAFKVPTGQVRSVAFSPDGCTLAAGMNVPDGDAAAVRLWDMPTGQERAVLKGPAGNVTLVAFNPDGKTLAAAIDRREERGGLVIVSWPPRADSEVWLWDVVTGQERAVLQGHTDIVTWVAFSGNGKTLASGSVGFDAQLKPRLGEMQWKPWPGEVRLWDLDSSQERAVLQGHTGWVTSVAFSGDGKTLASGSWDKTVRLWDLATGQERAVLQGHMNIVTTVATSGDGKTLASGGEDAQGRGEVRLWDVVTGQERAVLQGHTFEVTSVAFSGDSKTLASASRDYTVRLWDLTALPEPLARNASPH